MIHHGRTRSSPHQVQENGLYAEDRSQTASERTVTAHDPEQLSPPQGSNLAGPPDGGYGWVCVACCFFINAHTWGINSVRRPSSLARSLLTLLSSHMVFSSPIILQTTLPRRYPSGVRFRWWSVYLHGTSRFACRNICDSSAWHANNFNARSLLRNFVFDWSVFLHANMAAVFEPGSVLWMGHGFPVRGLGWSRTAMVHKERKPSKWHCHGGQRHWGYDIQLGHQRYATEHWAGLGFSDTRDSGIRCQPHLCNSHQRPKQGYWGHTVSIRLPPIQENRVFAAARLGLLQYARIHCSSVLTTKLALTIGLSSHQGSIIGALLNLGQGLGRPAVGIFSDRAGRINIAGFLTFVCGLFCFVSWIFSKGFGVLVFFALMVGTVAGIFWTTIAPVGAEVVGLKELPSALSITWIVLILPCTYELYTENVSVTLG